MRHDSPRQPKLKSRGFAGAILTKALLALRARRMERFRWIAAAERDRHPEERFGTITGRERSDRGWR